MGWVDWSKYPHYDYNIFRENKIKIVKIYMNGFIKCNGKVIFPDTLVAVPKE